MIRSSIGAPGTLQACGFASDASCRVGRAGIRIQSRWALVNSINCVTKLVRRNVLTNTDSGASRSITRSQAVAVTG
jgi:hypothetical protein